MDKMDTLKDPRGYTEDFDPDWYLENYVKSIKKQVDNRGIYPFAMDFLHEIFSTGNYSGTTLLDIGTGPSVYSVISASRHVQEIHLSDIHARNREILQTWRDGTDNCSEIFEYACEKEGEGLTVDQRSEEVRQKVSRIFEVDLRKSMPLKDSECVYDIITTSLVLCAIATTETEFTGLLKKVAALLKPKGYLVVVGALNCTFYQVGGFRFPSLTMEGKEVKGWFLKENLKILEWRESNPDTYSPEYAGASASDEGGAFAVLCQKM